MNKNMLNKNYVFYTLINYSIYVVERFKNEERIKYLSYNFKIR